MSSDKQPIGIWPISFSELFERYAFYILQVLLVYYLMDKPLELSNTMSYSTVGSFMALAYILPIIGGLIADNLLGYKHTIIFGGCVLIIGYATIMIPDAQMLFFGLGAIAVGTGLFKPITASLLGTLYKDNDPRRDSGFTIYYVCFNLGTFLSLLLSGYVRKYFGWEATFLTACVGLIIGLSIFCFGLKLIKPVRKNHISTQFNIKKSLGCYLFTIIMIYLASIIIRYDDIAMTMLVITLLLSLAIFLVCARKSNILERKKLFAFFMLCCLSVLFWSLFYQIYFAINLFITHMIDHDFMGIHLTTPAIINISQIALFTLGPLISKLWIYLKDKPYNPSTPTKFSISTILLSVPFLLISLGIINTEPGQPMILLWLIIPFIMFSLSELLLSPIGIAMVTELIPLKWNAIMMGIWYISLGVGSKLAGFFASYAAIPNDYENSQLIHDTYLHAFILYAGLAFIFGIISFILRPYIIRLIKIPT